MRPSTLFGLSLPFLLPFAALANPHVLPLHHRHRDIATRAKGDVQLHKRFDNARFTFYDVGLGACGKWNVETDFIVALNTPQYGAGYPGPHCFQSITISWNGKTTNAVIMDECPGCPYGGLDMSRGLFKFFADESVGVLYGTWNFNNGGGGGGDPSPSPPPPPPPPSSTHHTTPTSTYTPPPPAATTTSTTPTTTPTTTSTKEQTTTTKTSTSTSSSSSTSSSTSSSSSNSASPTPPSTDNVSGGPADDHTLNSLNEAVLALGRVVVEGAQAH